MIKTALIVAASVAATAAIARRHETVKFRKLDLAHTKDSNRIFHESFKQGWDDGFKQGQRSLTYKQFETNTSMVDPNQN
jgi:hypothetical protein